MGKKDGMTSLRLPKALLDELDTEVAILAKEPIYLAVRVTRGVTINMAIAEWIERRKAARKPKPP